LKSISKNENASAQEPQEVTKLIHQESLLSSTFFSVDIFLNEMYIVTILERSLIDTDKEIEMFVHLRSTTDPSEVYSFAKERMDAFACFGFTIAIQVVNRTIQSTIK
jgi:hypothetical protein